MVGKSDFKETPKSDLNLDLGFVNKSETIEHMIAHCEAYQNIRERIIQEFEALCSKSKNGLSLKSIVNDPTALTQFVLDPSSFNLPQRININDPILVDMFKLSRDFCYAVHAERKRLMQ